MRKIETRKDVRKRKKRNQLTIGLILILVMFGSVFGIVANSFGGGNGSNAKTINYHGYTFTESGNYWLLEIGGAQYLFSHNPLEIENSLNATIDGVIKGISNYAGEPLYIDAQNSNLEGEIYTNFVRNAERVQRACITEKDCEEGLPIKTCADNFIIIKEGEEKITQENNCVIISGENEKLLKLTDDFLLRTIGVK